MPDRNPIRTRHRRRRDARVPLGCLALIVGVGALAFSNSLDNPFLWDDRTAIVENPTIRAVWPPAGPLVPPLDTPVSRRPLVNLTFAINYAVHGLDVTGYHVVNLAAHVLAACLLFGIVRRTLASERLRDRWDGRASMVALIATLLWMVHPLVSEVVNYTTQRTTVMGGVFFFATLYAAQRALGSAHRGRWHAAAVTACALGMMSKESVAVAPLVVVLYDRSFAFPTFRQAMAVRARFYGALAITWVPLGALLALRPHTTVGFATDVTPWTYLLNQAQIVPHYLRLAAWPDALVLDYGFPRALAPGDVAGGALLIAVLLVCTLVALVRWPAVGFLGAAFFLKLAPSSSVVPIATEVGAERRMYLPLAAIVVLAAVSGAWLLDWVLTRTPARFRRTASAVAVLLAAACVTGLTTRTMFRNAEFSTARSIWRTSVERWPHGRARTSYAAALIEIGEEDLALRQLKLAVPDFPLAHFALGNELAARHHYDEALEELSTFIRADPRAPDRIPARRLRARILADQGHVDEAVDEFRSLVDLFPSTPALRADFADLLLYERRDYEQAAVQYRRLLNRHPDRAAWLVNLGLALTSTGRLAEAMTAYQRALQVEPGATTARLRLADLLLSTGNAQAAAEHAQAVLALNPGNAVAHNLLGVALATEGRLTEAVVHFEASAEIAPEYAEARRNLDHARELLRRGAPPRALGAGTAK